MFLNILDYLFLASVYMAFGLFIGVGFLILTKDAPEASQLDDKTKVKVIVLFLFLWPVAFVCFLLGALKVMFFGKEPPNAD